MTCPLENSLTTIASTGELDILNNRNYTLGVTTLTDNARIVLDGGTLSGGALVIGATGELTGFGTVTDPTNNGIIDANGSDLNVTIAIGGSGRLQIESGSELELGAATGEAVTYEATSGKLRINLPATANYTGTINNFSGRDIIELANTNATTATPGAFNGITTTLTVNLSGGGALTYTLAGNYANDSFLVTHGRLPTKTRSGSSTAPGWMCKRGDGALDCAVVDKLGARRGHSFAEADRLARIGLRISGADRRARPRGLIEGGRSPQPTKKPHPNSNINNL